MKKMWNAILNFIFVEKPKRLELVFVPHFPDGDRLCREGWVIAKEEDTNTKSGWVYLEKLEKLNESV